MNYFVGVLVTGYIGWFYMNFDAPKSTKDITTAAGKKEAEDFANMYNWLVFNFFYTFFCLLMVIIISFIYRNMNKKA